MSKDDVPAENCRGCRYRMMNKECRRHSPFPGNDERFVVAVWNFTEDTERCGAGSATKGIVRCDDCIHWYLPDGKPLNPNYKQGLPAEWWENARLCTASSPGATTHERRPTYWRVTSAFPINGLAGGCGDGQSITEILEAAERKKTKDGAG
jgi:hypothetical protein